MVELIVNSIFSQIINLNNPDVIKILDYNLSYYVQGYAFTKAYKQGWWDPKKRKWQRWDGKNHLLDDKLRFQTGLLSKVKTILDNNGIKYTIDDKRKEIKFGKKIKTKNTEFREYQSRVVETAIRGKGGIIKAATGSGKSVMINNLIAETNVKTVVYVIGIDLLYQMVETFEKMLGTEVGIIGDGKANIKKINVCTVWTAANALGNEYVPFDDEESSKKETINEKDKSKIIKAIKDAQMIIFDECQMLAAKTLQVINSASENAYYKYGFSGTPFRDDGADILLEAVCGKIIIEVTASELIKDGFLVQPTIHFIEIPEYKGKLSDPYPTVYKEYIVENQVRNDKIISITEKLIKSNRKALILVKTIKHGDIILDALKKKKLIAHFVKGDLDSDERNSIRQKFLKGKIDVIVASAVYDQGVDLKNLDALVLAGSGKSSGRALQRIGRVIRPSEGKKDAVVIDFIDNAKYLKDHSKKRMEVYKREGGFVIKLPTKKDDINDDESGSGPKEEKKNSTGKRMPYIKRGDTVPW